MKQQIFNTGIGLAALSIFVTLILYILKIVIYLNQNYVFNPRYFVMGISITLILGLSNELGNFILKYSNKGKSNESSTSV